jgi:hypothetical protein
MRALFLIPGTAARQLQLFAAVAAVAEQLSAQVQVVCPPKLTGWWGLHPAVQRAIPFQFEGATLADWSNLLGTVREPDFQLCINLAAGRAVDLTLSMSHIPTRVAAGGFSATDLVSPSAGWPAQAIEAYLRPVGVTLRADDFRLQLGRADLEAAAQTLPAGSGPLLLLAPAGGPGDWPAQRWLELPERIRSRLGDLRLAQIDSGDAPSSPRQRAAQLASADVVLASDPLSIELALMLGLPLVTLGRHAAELPCRPGLQAVGGGPELRGVSVEGLSIEGVSVETVMAALGFG